MPPRSVDDCDWAATDLPPAGSWPPGLRSLVATVLGAPVPMALALGDRFVLVYNDAYAALLGAKHPDAFGRPAAEVLAENWDAPGHRDVVEHVYRTGESFFDANTVLPLRRGGTDSATELVHFTRAYTAARSDAGDIIGVLSVISETSEANRTLTGVADLTARLSAAASVDSVTREALAYAVEALNADHARVVLSDGPALRIARRARVDGTDDVVGRLPPVWARVAPHAHLPSVEVTDSGEALWLDARSLDRFDDLENEPLAVERLGRVATIPLRTGTVRGAMSLAWEAAGTFTDAERSALIAVGNLIAQSLARAQRFDEQRDLADTLQLSMLPAALPQLPGIGLGARYVPSGSGAAAGGDFYDAFDVGDGLHVVVIGDVVGHGVQAATVMGQVRAATRVLALRDPDPAAVLAGLDPFVAGLGGESFVTMIVSLLDPQARKLRVACAGHPAPVLCRRESRDQPYDAAVVPVVPGAPVGIGGDRPATELELQSDDVLVLYTDGLVEVPGEDPDAATARLVEQAAAAAITTDPRRICGELLEHRRAVGDDAALLVLAVHERQHLIAALELPAESTSPRQARAWSRAVLSTWRLGEALVEDALLCISELVSNAVLHARSGARVELDLDDSRLLALVTDTGTGDAPVPQPAEPTASRGRGLSVIDRLATAWGSEQSSRGTTVWFELARAAGDGPVQE
jgi:anti-sigma regulatory factor (Ser/Thr protein kinase)